MQSQRKTERKEKKYQKTNQNNKKTNYKVSVASIYLSIIMLSLHGLNSPIKRHRVTECINKKDPTVYFLQETHFTNMDAQTESEGREIIPYK